MSSGVTEFLDYTGPVQKDTSITRSGVKWNNTSPVGEVAKSPVSVLLPAVPLTPLPGFANGILVQFNYTAPHPFSLLDWNSVINVSLMKQMGLFLAIRYRVGNASTRYRLCGDLPIAYGPPITFSGGGINIIPAPLYNGQLIKPQFVLECWGNITTQLSFSIAFPLVFQTSILNTPAPFPCVAVTQLAPTITGIQTSNLFLNTPVPMPMQFNPSGPWNSN